MEISKLSGQMDSVRQQADVATSLQNQRTGTVNANFNPTQAQVGSSLNQQKNDEQKQSLNEQLNDVVKELNQQMDYLNTNVRFGFSDDINAMYVTISEINTGKEIRQIPAEEAIKLTKYFRDAIGLIFDKES